MRNVIEMLALPPTCLVFLTIIALLLRYRWRRVGVGIAWIALIALVLLGMPIVSRTMLVALETNLPTETSPDHPPAAIVVLGGEVTRDRGPLGSRPGPLTLDRLRTAAALSRRTGLPILVTGGTALFDTAAVGTVMGQSLRDDFQTPARWVEDKSVDTWENARFSADILRREGINSVYVVTSAWHMRRALLAFQGTGLTVTAAPTPPDVAPEANLDSFVPRAGVWQAGYYALHEWLGYAWYTVR